MRRYASDILRDLEARTVLLEKQAGWAGTGYGGTLSPSVTEPGEGYKIVKSGGEVYGWDKYAQIVAESFKKAPDYTAKGEKSFIALKMHILRMYQRMQSKVEVKFVDFDPYTSAEEMRQDVLANNRLLITELFNQDGFFGAEVNLMLRAVHDFSAHLNANPKKKPRPFGVDGELKAYNKHLQLVGKTSRAAPAIFTEVVGQACHFWFYGEFPDQKIITLDNIDHINLGRVDGYSIIDGNLVKR
jgi:hypothetical protein